MISDYSSNKPEMCEHIDNFMYSIYMIVYEYMLMIHFCSLYINILYNACMNSVYYTTVIIAESYVQSKLII